jgi:hypothetical protein
MTDGELIDALHYLGIDESNGRVIALLPLVQVAWADGIIQARERDTILEIGRREGFLDDESEALLDNWLAHAPTDTYHQRGRDVILELARRGGGFGTTFTASSVDQLVGFCEVVAKCAGGLLGLVFSVNAQERAAIKEIAEALRIAESENAAWGGLRFNADDDPP